MNTTLVSCSIVIALLIIECALPYLGLQGVDRRVYQYRRPIVQYMFGNFHPELGYTLLPNLANAHIKYEKILDYSFNTNKEGFRGHEWDFAKNRKNIIVLGDSFAFGWGVGEEEMFSSLLEKKLQKINPAIQVLNMSQSGYYLDQILNTFRIVGKKFDPILIIYLYCYNDPIAPPPLEKGEFGIESFRTSVSKDSWLEEARRNNVNVWRFERAWEGSYTFCFYKNYLAPLFAPDKAHPRRAWKDRYIFTNKNLSPPTPPLVPIPRKSIQQQYVWYCLNKLYEDSGQKPLILMDTSDKVFVHLADRADSDRWLLRDFAALKENVFFADFESEIRLRNDGVARFFNVDDHWNEEGHQLATIMINEIIERNPSLFGIE